jgi:DNA-binding Lrp family transcriptional regulator
MTKLDKTDKSILELLQENARLTIKEIAGKLHLSTTPIFERIKKLEKNGIINRYVALLNHRKLGKKLTAFIDISIKDHSKSALEAFVRQIITYDEILECHHVTGESDFMLKVVLRDVEAYNDFVLEKLSTVPNIGKIESRFSLSTRKSTTAIRLED